MIQPKNKLYLTSQDFEQWQDYFGKLVMGSGEIKREVLADGKLRDPDLKVKNITFVVTEDCNLRCSYCYQPNKTHRVMSKEVARDSVDFILNSEKINGYYSQDSSPGVILDFIGGEPLLEIDLINYIVEYFKFKAFEMDSPWATNYMVSISTNGILYKDKRVQDFLKRNKGRVSLGISIDGDKELHNSCRVFPSGQGSYDIVADAVKLWVQNEEKPQTKMTLSPANVSYLFNAIKNVWEIGVTGVYCNCCYEEGWDVSHARIFYSELKKLADYILDNGLYSKYFVSLFDETIGKKLTETKNWCGGNGKMLAIGTDGKCYPCVRYMQFSLSTPGRKEQPIGDICHGLDSRDGNQWLDCLCKINMTSQSNEKCNTCPIATGCSLCTAYHYDKFGDPNIRATYICEMHQARVIANYYYWNKLYKKLDLSKSFDLNIPRDWALKIISEEEYDNI